MIDQNQVLSLETIKALNELGVVLQGIHTRLMNEGYIITDGSIHKPLIESEQKNSPPEKV